MATDGHNSTEEADPDLKLDPARAAPKTRATFVWRLTRRKWMEPDYKWLEGGVRTPLLYRKVYIDSYRSLGIYRSDIDATNRAVLKAGGVALLGMYGLLCSFAMDTGHFMRGYLVDRSGLPAGPGQIAEMIGLPTVTASAVARAIRALRRPEIALVERVDFRVAWEAEDLADREQRARWLAKAEKAAKAKRRARGRREDGPGPEDVNDQSRPDDARDEITRPPARAGPPGRPGGGRAGGEESGKPGTVAAAAGYDNFNGNRNGNDNRNGPAGAGEPGCRAACGNGRNGNENGRNDNGAAGNGDDDTNADGKGDRKMSDTARAGRGRAPGCRPPAGTGPAEADGDDAGPASPARPDIARRPLAVEAAGGGVVEVVPDAETWKQVRLDPVYPSCWAAVREDASGLTFGRVIYRALGFHVGTGRESVRHYRRETGTFRRRWRCALATPLDEAVLLKLAEAAIRKARALASQARDAAVGQGGLRNRGAAWNTWWRKRLANEITAAVEAKRKMAVCKGG